MLVFQLNLSKQTKNIKRKVKENIKKIHSPPSKESGIELIQLLVSRIHSISFDEILSTLGTKQITIIVINIVFLNI